MKTLTVALLLVALHAAMADWAPYEGYGHKTPYYSRGGYNKAECAQMYRKRDRYGHCSHFKYAYDHEDGYKLKTYGRKCRTYASSSLSVYPGQCVNKPPYGNSYSSSYSRKSKCKKVECDQYVTRTLSKCHGYVKLVKPYHDEAYECGYEHGNCGAKVGISSYRGYGSYGGSRSPYRSSYGPKRRVASGYKSNYYGCQCQTKTWNKQFEACYRHKGYTYKHYVMIEKPYSCECFKKKKYQG